MITVYQVCRSEFEDGGGLGGGGYYSDPQPVKTFSSKKKAVAYLKETENKKDWKVKWCIKPLEVY